MAFDWDENNLGHILLHAVTQAEVEEAFQNDPVQLDSYVRNQELRYAMAGVTNKGRVLAVIFTVKEDGTARVVTAHESRKLRPYFF